MVGWVVLKSNILSPIWCTPVELKFNFKKIIYGNIFCDICVCVRYEIAGCDGWEQQFKKNVVYGIK